MELRRRTIPPPEPIRRKPGGGRKSNEELARIEMIDRKKRLMESFYKQAENLIDKNPSEARQCLQTAKELEVEIKSLEAPKKEEPKEEARPKDGPIFADYDPKKIPWEKWHKNEDSDEKDSGEIFGPLEIE